MAIQSDNEQGNQWHSSKDGKFISGPNGDSIGVSELTLANFGLDNDLDIDELGQMVDLADDKLNITDFFDEEQLDFSDFDDDQDEEDEENEELDTMVGMSEDEYELIHNQGRTIPAFDDFNGVMQNLDAFFDDNFVQGYFKENGANINGGMVTIKNTPGLRTGVAFDFLTRARSASTHFKGISNEEFEEKMLTMPQDNSAFSRYNDISRGYIPYNEVTDMFDVFLKGGQTAYVPLWHGMAIQSHRNMRTIMCQYKDNVKGGADTVLIGDGCYDYACYCAFAKGYSYGGYSGGNVDGALIRLLAPIDKNTKICIDDFNGSINVPNAPKNWRTKNNILKEYNSILPQLKQKVSSILQRNGVHWAYIKDFTDSLDPNYDGYSRSVPLVFLGFDYVLGDDQLDILNPSRVLMNKDKYRPDDD